MAVIKTRWKAALPKKEAEEKFPKKKAIAPKVEEVEKKVEMPVIDDPTAEEFIATLPKKQQRGKKVVKIIEE